MKKKLRNSVSFEIKQKIQFTSSRSECTLPVCYESLPKYSSEITTELGRLCVPLHVEVTYNQMDFLVYGRPDDGWEGGLLMGEVGSLHLRQLDH